MPNSTVFIPSHNTAVVVAHSHLAEICTPLTAPFEHLKYIEMFVSGAATVMFPTATTLYKLNICLETNLKRL